MAVQKLSAKEAALQLGTDARTLRKFIRQSEEFEAVGQGNRYEFTKGEIGKLKKAFMAWSVGGKKPVQGTEKKASKVEEPEEEVDEIIIDDEDDNPHPHRTTGEDEVEYAEEDDSEWADFDGPTDDEIEEIELED